jgi:hypothetical protein
MPAAVVGQMQRALNDTWKPIRGSRAQLLGVAYKADVDRRCATALEVWVGLAELGVVVQSKIRKFRSCVQLDSIPRLPVHVARRVRLRRSGASGAIPWSSSCTTTALVNTWRWTGRGACREYAALR